MQSAMPKVVRVIFGKEQPDLRSGDVTTTGEVVIRMDDLKSEQQQAIFDAITAR